MMLTDFHFLNPWGLLLFPLLVLAILLLARRSMAGDHWRSVCDDELLPLLEEKTNRPAKKRSGWFILIALLLSMAVAQPVWRQQPQPVFKQPAAVVVVLDLSLSMYAADLKPNRLQRARFKIQDLLDKLEDAQVALVVYAAEAFSVTPLTEDADAVAGQLEALSPEIMPAQGSRADRAILMADTLLAQAGVARGNIVIISDDVSPGQIAAAATEVRSKGRTLSILAVGTEAGAPVYLKDQPLRDADGQTIVAQMSFALMQEAAMLGGGHSVQISPGDQDIKALLADIQTGDPSEVVSEQEVQRWVAEGPWFVLAALLLLAPLFRRGLLNLLLPALLLTAVMQHTPVQAAETSTPAEQTAIDRFWQSLWQTDDQRGYQAYQQDYFAAAAQDFKTPDWKQAALYKSGDYEAALNALPTPESAEQWYNRGNVLARMGQLEDALTAYEEALKQKQRFPDAEFNRDLVKQALEQQKEQPQQDKQAQQQGGASPDPSKNEQGQESDQEKSEGGGAMDQNFQQQGAQGGSSQNGIAQSGDFSNQTEASQQHARSKGAGVQAASRGDNDQTDAAEQEAQRREALKQQLKDSLDQQLEQSKTQSQAEAASDTASGQQGDNVQNQTDQAAETLDEAAMAREQMLNQIEDDPAGLWRRKFLYQYRDRAEQHEIEAKQW